MLWWLCSFIPIAKAKGQKIIIADNVAEQLQGHLEEDNKKAYVWRIP